MQSFLYTPSKKVLASFAAAPSMKAEAKAFSPAEPQPQSLRNFFAAGRSISVPAASEGPIALYSPQFYAACTVGGERSTRRQGASAAVSCRRPHHCKVARASGFSDS